jgi:hypothetical protein
MLMIRSNEDEAGGKPLRVVAADCQCKNSFFALSIKKLPIDVLSNLVDPASSHMLVSKIKPCKSKYKLLYGKTANSSLQEL